MAAVPTAHAHTRAPAQGSLPQGSAIKIRVSLARQLTSHVPTVTSPSRHCNFIQQYCLLSPLSLSPPNVNARKIGTSLFGFGKGVLGTQLWSKCLAQVIVDSEAQKMYPIHTKDPSTLRRAIDYNCLYCGNLAGRLSFRILSACLSRGCFFHDHLTFKARRERTKPKIQVFLFKFGPFL